MATKKHSDHKYIAALLNNDSLVLTELYTNFSGKVISFIKKNRGTETQANDIIQEALIAIFHQAKEKDLVLTCPFDAYFFLICKRKWLNELKKNKKEVTILEENVSISDEQEEIALEHEVYEKRNALFMSKFKLLGKKCQDLLKASFKLKNLEEVAKQLGVSYGYVRRRKSLCTGELTKLITASDRYKQLKNNNDE